MSVTIDGTNGVTTPDVEVSSGGSASAPAITVSGDTNTGIFFPAADTIAFAEGGAEAMRIDSSGNVGIGTSSPSSRMSVAVSSTSTSVLGSYANIPLLLQNTSSTDNNWSVIAVQDASGDFSSYIGTQNTSQSSNTAIMAFATNSGSGATERARITSGGELILARTTLIGTERFSIDVDGSKQGQCIRSTNTSGNPNIFRIATGQLSGGIGTGRFITCDDGGGDKFFVAGSGVVNSTSASITTISDQRLKENVRDLETGLPEIMQLKPRRFDWKESQGTGKKNVVGFIAQEVESVLPDLIGEWKNQDEETIYKSLAMGDMLPTLVKAIQELKAINDAQASRIETLEAKIAALEAK